MNNKIFLFSTLFMMIFIFFAAGDDITLSFFNGEVMVYHTGSKEWNKPEIGMRLGKENILLIGNNSEAEIDIREIGTFRLNGNLEIFIADLMDVNNITKLKNILHDAGIRNKMISILNPDFYDGPSGIIGARQQDDEEADAFDSILWGGREEITEDIDDEFGRAMRLYMDKQYRVALEVFLEYLSGYDKADIEKSTYYHIAQIYYKLYDYTKAFQMIQKAEEYNQYQGPEKEVVILKFLILLKQGNIRLAESVLMEIKKKFPGETAVVHTGYLLLGFEYRLAGKADRAGLYFEMVLEKEAGGSELYIIAKEALGTL